MTLHSFEEGSRLRNRPDCTEIRVNGTAALRYYPDDGTLALADTEMAAQLILYFDEDDDTLFDVNIPGRVVGLPSLIRFTNVSRIISFEEE